MKGKRYHVLMAVLVTIAGFALFLFLAVQAGTQLRPAPVQGVVNDAVASLSDIVDTTSASVTNNGPARLQIPSIGVDTVIEHVGLNDRNEIGIPTNFVNVAWYDQSPKPGQKGNSVIDGHFNDKLSRPAVFWDLEKLKVGDHVIVTDTDGTMHTFSVRETAIYDVKSAPMEKIIGPSSEAHLNLITCTGTWLKSDRMYDKRLVVFTDLVK